MQRRDTGPNPPFAAAAASSTPSWSETPENHHASTSRELSPGDMAYHLRQLGFEVIRPEQASFLRTLSDIARQKKIRDISDNQWLASLPPETRQDVLDNSNLYNIHQGEYVLGAEHFNSLLHAGLGFSFANLDPPTPAHATATATGPAPASACTPPQASTSTTVPSFQRTAAQAAATASSAFARPSHQSVDVRPTQPTDNGPVAASDSHSTTSKATQARKQYRSSSRQLIIRHKIKSLKRNMAKSSKSSVQVVDTAPAAARLPPEILVRIFRHAQIACRTDSAAAAEAGNGTDTTEAQPTDPGPPYMTFYQAQWWALSLTRVCKAWRPTALYNVWTGLYIRDITCLDRILQTLTRLPHFGGLMSHYVTVYTGKYAVGNNQVGAEPDGRSNKTGRYLEQSDPDDLSFDDERHSFSKVAQLLRFAPLLQDLSLFMCQRHAPRPPIKRNAGVPFMNASLHHALSLSALRIIHFDFVVIFADLECLLLESKTLREILLYDGVDAVDMDDAVNRRAHELPLEELVMSHRYHLKGSIGSRQLNWILRPAIGHLKKLSLVLPVLTRIVPHQDGTNTTFVLAQPYATTLFANTLIELSSTLLVLILSTATFRPIMGSALNEDPHRGSLDFALSHCTRIGVMSLPWQLTSTRFLASIAQMPALEFLGMEGHPPASCDPHEFVTMLENRVWPKLHDIQFEHFTLGYQSHTWTAQHLRRLIRLCKSMNIDFDAQNDD